MSSKNMYIDEPESWNHFAMAHFQNKVQQSSRHLKKMMQFLTILSSNSVQ